MKRYIDEINNNITNIRTAIKDQGADIDENTPLDKYAEKIESIEKTKVTVGHTIIPFYCYADNYYDASEKEKPEITGNSDKGEGDVQDNKGGWTKNVPSLPSPEEDSEPLLYAMFVPIKYKQNSNDDDFEWPTPIQIQGKQGEKGDTGRDGRDGVIAGMIQYLAAHLFKVIRRINAKTELQNKPELKYDYASAKNQGEPEPNFLYTIPETLDNNGNITSYLPPSVSSNGGGGLSYTMPESHPKDYVVLKCVASYNSVDDTVTVTDPIMLSGEGVVGGTEYYCVTSDNTEPSEDATGTSNAIPEEFYNAGKHYLGNKTEIEYDSGRTVTTHPVMIMSSPNAVDTIECLYGQSSNISTEPEDWNETIPDDFIVLGKKETTNFTLGNSKVTTTPIAVKGNPGVDILAQVNKQDIKTGTSANMAGFNSEEYYLKKGIVVGKDLYIGNGSVEPDGADTYEKAGTYYGIVIQDAFATKVQADGNENDDTMPGYIKNRPITSNDGEVRVCTNNLYFTYSKIYLPVFPHVKVNTITLSLPIGLSGQNEYILTKDNNTCTIDGTTFTWEDSIITASSNVFENGPMRMCVTMSGTQTRLSQKYVDNIIDLGDKALLKILWLKNSSKLIPGCTYKFTYSGTDYLVNAINSGKLAETCVSEYHTIIVNWDFFKYKTIKGGIIDNSDVNVFMCGRGIKGSGQDGHVRKEEYYEVETNCFLYYIPNGSPADMLSLDVDTLDVRGYKDHRGNEGNAYLNEFSGTYTITFDETCFCNKVDVYLTGTGANTIKISNNSNNNTFVCYNGANITCDNSVGNSINTYNVTNQMTITNSNLNRVSLYNNQTFELKTANCNIVNVRSISEWSNLKLQEINNNLTTLHNLNETLTISNDYSGCGIFSINAFKNKTANTASIYATDVYDL